MKKPILIFVLSLISIPLPVFSQRTIPVRLSSYSIDTSLYNSISDQTDNTTHYTGPLSDLNQSEYYAAKLRVYRKKNSNEFDIYCFGQKLGTAVVSSAEKYSNISFSKEWIDSDAGWEAICSYHSPTDNEINLFKILDDDGFELLSDTGSILYYRFDGINTYIVKEPDKLWRLRTNVSNSSSQALAKTKSLPIQHFQIFSQNNGSYQVRLSPSSGDCFNFQLFDLTGRLLFTKQIINNGSGTTFNIPASNVSQSPFIAKVSDGKNSLYKKQIPVR